MDDIIGKVRDVLSLAPARRGQLSEQYYKGRLASGEEVVRGPYYVLQWYEGGRKRSLRVKAGDVARVREELERGRKAEALLDEVREGAWKALGGPAQKKTAGGSGRNSARSTRRRAGTAAAST